MLPTPRKDCGELLKNVPYDAKLVLSWQSFVPVVQEEMKLKFISYFVCITDALCKLTAASDTGLLLSLAILHSQLVAVHLEEESTVERKERGLLQVGVQSQGYFLETYKVFP